MKQKLISVGIMAASVISFSAYADHNSKFGVGTGYAGPGVHSDRIESNTKGPDNRLSMGRPDFNVVPGASSQHQQMGAPSTVVPGGSKR